MRVAILGAGAGGLSLARQLSGFQGIRSVVMERSARVGGLQRSQEIDGVHYDVGTFLFHEGHGLLETFPEIQADFLPISYRPVSLTPGGGCDRYPFTVGGYVRENGLAWTLLSGFDLLLSKAVHFRKRTMPSYAKYYTGSIIYRRSGLKRYVRRLHDESDDQIDVEFARRRMHVLARNSLREVVKKALSRSYRSRSAGRMRQRLVRPVEGFDSVYQRIRALAIEAGAEIRTNCRVESIKRSGQHFVVQSESGKELFDRVASTIPIPAMLRLIGLAPGSAVETRSLVSLFYRGTVRNDASAIFNFTDEGRWKRITVFSRFYGRHQGEDYFTVEATSRDSRPETVDEIRRDFERHAARLGIFEEPRLVGLHTSRNAYPLYRRGQMQEVLRQKEALAAFGIDLVGRQGNYEYVISDVVARRAKSLADTIGAKLHLSQDDCADDVAPEHRRRLIPLVDLRGED